MFPQAIDRMRIGNKIYHALLVSISTEVINTALSELREANDFLSSELATQSINPTQPASIIRHDLEQPGGPFQPDVRGR